MFNRSQCTSCRRTSQTNYRTEASTCDPKICRLEPVVSYRRVLRFPLALTLTSTTEQRFEVDGANAARQFLSTHRVPEEQVERAWQAIALHTTPGVTQYMRPEVALLYSGEWVSMCLEEASISFLRSCARKSWPNILESTSNKVSSRSTLPAFRTSPTRPTAP
jgi:hypothetical protein